MPARRSASTNPSSGPLPWPSMMRSSPRSMIVTLIVRPLAAGNVRYSTRSISPSPRYVWQNMAQISDELASLAGAVGPVLDDPAEFDLKRARQFETVVGLQQIGDAALPRLAVDADNRLVAAAEVLWVDGEVGHFPELIVALRQRLEALLDRVLVRTGKRRVN